MSAPSPRKKRRKGPTVDSHNHPPVDMQPPPFGGRQPSAGTVIAKLNAKLDEQANLVRRLEDQIVWRDSLIEDLITENTGYVAAIDQMRAENLVLRRRFDLPDAGPLEVADSETTDALG